MSYIKSYKELIVWQKSILLIKNVYELCHQLPKNEEYTLSSQIKRSAISIAANIAEGYKRKGIGEFINFLSIADASAAELETHLIIIKEIYPTISTNVIDELLEAIQKMLISMIKKLKEKNLNANR